MTTVYELSKQLKIHKRNVHDLIRDLNIEVEMVGGNNLFLISDIDAELIRLHCVKYQKSLGGVTISDIASEFSVSRTTVWAIVKGMGITSNTSHTIVLSPHEADRVRGVLYDRKAKQ